MINLEPFLGVMFDVTINDGWNGVAFVVWLFILGSLAVVIADKFKSKKVECYKIQINSFAEKATKGKDNENT